MMNVIFRDPYSPIISVKRCILVLQMYLKMQCLYLYTLIIGHTYVKHTKWNNIENGISKFNNKKPNNSN